MVVIACFSFPHSALMSLSAHSKIFTGTSVAMSSWPTTNSKKISLDILNAVLITSGMHVHCTSLVAYYQILHGIHIGCGNRENAQELKLLVRLPSEASR